MTSPPSSRLLVYENAVDLGSIDLDDKPVEEGVNTFASLLDTTEEFEKDYEIDRMSLD